MDDGELVSLFSFPCTIETIFFSADLNKPRKHDGDFAVGIKRREAKFIVAVKGKADINSKHYHLHNAIRSVKDTEWQKGKLTITFARGPLRQLGISEAIMTASLAECAEFLKKIINGLTVNEFLQNNVYCNRIPQNILSELRQKMEKQSLKPPPPSHDADDLDDFDLFTKLTPRKKLFTNKSTGSYGSRMLAASKDKSETKNSNFYVDDSRPSYSFASESPLIRPSNSKCPPVLSFKRSTPLLERNQHDPPAKRVCNSPPMTYSKLKSMKEGNNFKHSSSLIVDNPQPSFELKGFANLGNTCYMNAILQSLLGLGSFADDLLHYKNIKQLPPKCLFIMIYLLLKDKRANTPYSEIMLRGIKKSISTTAARFSGYSQHDAHEFLAQCLDQLKEDCLAIVPKVEDPCPVSQNFECTVEHTITCLSCGEHVKKQEVFQTFSVTIPDQQQSNAPGDHLTLQGLLDNFFNDEEVQYVCSSCKNKTAKLTHCFLQLPRVLIIHVKRYRLSNTHLSYYKRSSHIRIPKYLNIGSLCADEIVQCPPLLAKPQSSATVTDICTDSSLPATVNNKLPTTPLRSITNKPSRHPLLLDSFRSTSKNDGRSKTPTTPSSSLFKFYKRKTPVAGHKMEPRNLANILSSDNHVDNDIPSEEEQMRWALSASKDLAMLDGGKPVQVESDDEDDPEMARVLEESRLEYEQKNNSNSVSRHTPSPTASPSLLCDNNVTTDSGYFSSNIDLTKEDPLQHKERYCSNLSITPQRMKPIQIVDNNSTITSQAYQLASIVSHMGGTNAGHYISDVYCPGSGIWNSYNDSILTKMSEVEVRQRRQTSGYIFFYVNKSVLQLNK